MTRIGFDAKVYVDPDGVGVSVWDEVDIAQDITPTDGDNAIEVPDRRSRAKSYTHGRDDLSLEILVTQETDDPAYIALRDARIQRKPIGVAYKDGDMATEDTEGWEYDAKVFSMEPNIEIDGILACKFMLKPASGAPPERRAKYVVTTVT